MSKVGEEPLEVPHKQGPVARFFLWPVGLLYRLWTASIRIENVDSSGDDTDNLRKQPCILMLWHNRLFLAGEWHRRIRKDKTCYGLISASKDGALLETFYGWAGIRAVRGSRNRRGAQAVRELVRVMRKGHDIGVTPDGSRGPCYEAKSGALLVARLTKTPILFLSFEFGWSLKLKSWDRFVVPFPFSKVIANYRYLGFEDIFGDRDLDEATEFTQCLLTEMTKD
jgi:lysophospholipid acyltransferase (LPLAT)-like uncharacterized protein